MNLAPGGAEDRIVEMLKSLRRTLHYNEAASGIIGILAESVNGADHNKDDRSATGRDEACRFLKYLPCNYLDEEDEIRLALCSLGLLSEYPEKKLLDRRNSYILTTGYTGKRSLPDMAKVRELSPDELRRRRNSLEKYENDLYAKIAVEVVEDVASIEALEQLITEASTEVTIPSFTASLADKQEAPGFLQSGIAEDELPDEVPAGETSQRDTFDALDEKLRLDAVPPVPREIRKEAVLKQINRIREEMLEEIIGLDDSGASTDDDSFLALGICQEMGYGLSRDTDLALDAYMKAIKDDPRAGLMIGMRSLERGEGVLNIRQAVKYLRQAAKHGVAEGAYLIGLLYYYGHGIERNIESALAWMKLAAEQGYAPAVQKLAEIERMGL